MCYGWRGKIGLIYPATGTAAECEFHRFAPQGIATMTQRILFERVDLDGLKQLGDRAEEASKALKCADMIMFACTTGSLVGGAGYDQILIDRIEKASGLPALTTTTAVIAALKALKVKRLVVATPYSEEVNQVEKEVLEAHGFEVLRIAGLGNVVPSDNSRVTVQDMYHLSKEILHPDADALFVSCTGIGVVEGIKTMEKDFGLPVVTSVQASLWAALRMLSVREDIGLGKLFSL